MKNKITLLSIFLLIFIYCEAQTSQQRQQMVKSVDPIDEQELKQFILKRSKFNSKNVSDYLTANPSKAIAKTSDGEFKWLERIDGYGNPIYLKPYNYIGGISIGVDHLHSGGSLGLNIEGQGITAVIWDGGYTRESHIEILSRVNYGEEGQNLSDHGTHVGGTIISAGSSDLILRGMAPKGNLKSYRFDNDVNEMLLEAQAGSLLSNHSYGVEVTSETPVSYFGRYTESAVAFDFIAHVYPYFLPIVSAGNDRGQGFNRFDVGYDILTDRAVAKNVLTVGAVDNVFRYRDPSSVVMSTFSSFGPTDDGRIKPDIVAKGVGVLSLGSDSDTATSVKSGTSMSAPMVTGGLMLLQQLYNEEKGFYMKSATARGIALMTTKEAGRDPGPDYRFGWGLFDVEAAANMILNLDSSSIMIENDLQNNEIYEQRFVSENDERISFALSWTDAPGNEIAFDAEEDLETPNIINDLDLKVVDDQGVEYFPYKLDPSKPESAATTGVNNVDNIEIIHIDAPAGNYRVEITHKGELSETQAYSLLVNGATPQTASSSSEEISGLSIFPNPANEFVNITFDATTVSSKVNVQFYNTLGQMVRNESFNNNGRFNQQVNISDLGSGVYFVQISDGNLKSTRKLIIK
ncbi:S8 family serine peptidase [Nonlabens agnitus]|uniref:Peptidase S8 n=1 Tax=Nonlabens agnitus TaxID=870484 RepID=A0A2S9WS93_9FLAO|nr:S8 family serine peptidase [Nonlabens agnitus]PRP66351.1 hypothetical protein BST86_04225 [Nonlabens agnitus]